MHSGIGRISRLRMETMTLAELGVSSGAVSLETLLNGCPIKAALGSINGIADIADLLCRGGWPQAVGKTTADAMRISAAYIDGVCESDVSRVDGVKRDPGESQGSCLRLRATNPLLPAKSLLRKSSAVRYREVRCGAIRMPCAEYTSSMISRLGIRRSGLR